MGYFFPQLFDQEIKFEKLIPETILNYDGRKKKIEVLTRKMKILIIKLKNKNKFKKKRKSY